MHVPRLHLYGGMSEIELFTQHGFELSHNLLAIGSIHCQYSEADARLTDQESGATAVFAYTLPTSYTYFNVWPQGQVKYALLSPGAAFPTYLWSGATGVKHVINRS